MLKIILVYSFGRYLQIHVHVRPHIRPSLSILTGLRCSRREVSVKTVKSYVIGSVDSKNHAYNYPYLFIKPLSANIMYISTCKSVLIIVCYTLV